MSKRFYLNNSVDYQSSFECQNSSILSKSVDYKYLV